MIPVMVGGIVGFGAGYVAKKYYDENETEVNEQIDNGLKSVYEWFNLEPVSSVQVPKGLFPVQEWFDEKRVSLDKYLDSSNNKENKIQLEEEIVFDSLQQMKKKVYHDSFVDFTSFYQKIENADLGKIEYQNIEFDSKTYDEEIFDKVVQGNIKITTDLLFKANNLLNDMLINLEDVIKKSIDYNDFETREKELLKEAFSVARFIEKVCVNDSITEDVVVKFNSIISSL